MHVHATVHFFQVCIGPYCDSVCLWTLARQAPVPVAIGGAGLPADTKFREDLPNAGLANITGTYLNLLGFATPAHMEPSLI